MKLYARTASDDKKSTMALRSLRRAFAALVLLAAVGCGGAFRDAMDRGDSLASAGNWDAAAEAYAQAVQIDPEDEEAQEKLRHAKRTQAALRVQKGQALLAAGKAREAMVPFHEASKIDPSNRDAQSGYAKAKAVVLADAETALAQGRFKEAFDLARHILLIEPSDDQATALEAKAKEKIAQAAFVRGEESEKKGALAIALVDYGEALQFSRTHAGATARSTDLRARLRAQVTYWVALKNFDGEKRTDDFGSDVNADVLSRELDPSLPLRVVGTMPAEPKDKSYRLQGMRLGGVFRGYHFDKTSSRADRRCEYVCGKEHKPNPQYATAEAEMRTAQSALGSAEGRVSAAKAAVPAAERAVSAAKQRTEAARQELSRAEQDLSSCKSSSGGKANACSSEEQRRDRAKSDADRAEEDLRRAERAFDDAKREQSDAERDLSFKRMDADAKKRAFESTPSTVEVDKICPHRYSVETVRVAGEVECMLRGEGLYDTTAVLNRPVTGRFATEDETFPAQPGLCAEVAKPDPLRIPSEADVKAQVLAAAIDETAAQILGTFDGYRRTYFTRAKEAEKDGRLEEAADLYARFLLSRGEKDGGGDFDTAKKALARLRNVEKIAVDLAMTGSR